MFVPRQYSGLESRLMETAERGKNKLLWWTSRLAATTKAKRSDKQSSVDHLVQIE